MARPSIEDHPAFVECTRRMEPLKSRVADAKEQARVIVQVARDSVKRERLEIVRYAIEQGLSQYAVGKLTGVTTSADQKALIAEAMGMEWHPHGAAGNDPKAPAHVIEHDGWRAELTDLVFKGDNRFTGLWAVSHAEHGTALFDFTHYSLDARDEPIRESWVVGGLMPDEVFHGMREYVPEGVL